MAGIVNKVYCSCYTTHSPLFLCCDKLGSKRSISYLFTVTLNLSTQLMKANPHHRRSTKILIILFIFSKYPWKSLQWQKMIKVWILDFACHKRRLPAFNFSYSCNVGRGGGGEFPGGQTNLARYENANQSKSKLGLLLHGCQLPIDADLLKFLKACEKVLSV